MVSPPSGPIALLIRGREKSARTRSRSGCLPCRTRRRKCDGARPRCKACQARHGQCRWGLKASFHPSRSLRLSSEDTAALEAIESSRRASEPPNTQRPISNSAIIVDNTQEIIQSYEADIRDESSAGDSDLEIRNDGDGTLSIVVGTYPPPSGSQPPIQSSSYHVGIWEDTTAPASWIDVGVEKAFAGMRELSQNARLEWQHGGVVKACFWAFARIDIWAAYITNQTTLIPSELWVHDDCASSVAASGDLDDYCNLAIVAFSKIVNLLSQDEHSQRLSLSHFAFQVETSWNELQAWRLFRPREAMPLWRTEESEGSPFPAVIYAQASSICGNTFYHSGSILLLQTGVLGRTSDPPELLDPIFHAKEISAISICNNSHANWVNHLQPLYIAGTALGRTIQRGRAVGVEMNASPDVPSPAIETRLANNPGIREDISTNSAHASRTIALDSEEFAAEKFALLKQLARIERQTGWKTSGRARDLRILWGLEY
ncbi:unnamed protein product [Parascedosporium putredinis]|uniref:Zn(2)-C6 fungal-type domain-containing protein n=1 Tax=Parascedosporium putredinis TaxID=1442378 RepID=A0A9P1MGU6_9PEZI|nr:unnamed protein product [Parascedosporium putredinis]CAI8005097.1 unnamed protein product [Parascedosporium putredinis]